VFPDSLPKPEGLNPIGDLNILEIGADFLGGRSSGFDLKKDFSNHQIFSGTMLVSGYSWPYERTFPSISARVEHGRKSRKPGDVAMNLES